MIDVILPVLDEAAALPWLLGRFPAGFRPLVVDNGSSDGSAELAARLGATVVHEPARGFGAACWTGLLAATSDVVAFCDADGSLDPRHLPLVTGPLAPGPLAPGAPHATGPRLVLGARRPCTWGAWPPHARLANRYLARRLRRATGAALTDLGPMRAAPRVGLLELGLVDRRFGWPLEMVLRAAAAGWPVIEVPVPYQARTGRSKVTGTVRGTARAVRDMRQVLATLG